jgi:hypothetical protein
VLENITSPRFLSRVPRARQIETLKAAAYGVQLEPAYTWRSINTPEFAI